MSRPVSRSCSKIGGKVGGSGGEGVIEEEDGEWEWEYYYEEEEEGEEDELKCMSPASTYAPTTRATSPFPGRKHFYLQHISFLHCFLDS